MTNYQTEIKIKVPLDVAETLQLLLSLINRDHKSS